MVVCFFSQINNLQFKHWKLDKIVLSDARSEPICYSHYMILRDLTEKHIIHRRIWEKTLTKTQKNYHWQEINRKNKRKNM